MAQYAVGCVPYLNAKPLVRRFHEMGEASPVKVVYDVPSRLPALLASADVQAILVSSVEALRAPCRAVDGVSITTRGEVRSVRLFSKVSFKDIRTLALDQSSMTSNALALIVLNELFQAQPETYPASPDLPTMLASADAGILIGDAGMRAD